MNQSHVLLTIRKRATKQKVPYDLNVEWLKKRIKKGRCEVTNIPLVLKPSNVTINPFYPSIDRIEPGKGYIKDNCRVVVWLYNVLKADHTLEELHQFAEGFVEQYERNMI